jgi:hypothetical protein
MVAFGGAKESDGREIGNDKITSLSSPNLAATAEFLETVSGCVAPKHAFLSSASFPEAEILDSAELSIH